MLFDSYTVALCSFPLLQLFVTKRASPCAAVADGVSIYAFHIYTIFLLRRTHKPPTKWNEYCESRSHSHSLSHMFSLSLYSTLLYCFTPLYRRMTRETIEMLFHMIFLYDFIYVYILNIYITHTHTHTHTHMIMHDRWLYGPRSSRSQATISTAINM